VPGVPTFNQPYTCRLDAFAAAAAGRPAHAEPVFLFCGQMIARKGIDLLLSAFARLVAEDIPARLELVGREAELPALLAPLPPAVRARINYAGFQPPAELPATFARADVFVLPSRHDGWGVVVNQALGAGLPVICSDAVGAGHDLIRHEANGLVVPAGDVAALTTALRRLARSADLRRTLGAAARTTAEALAPERAAQFWEELAARCTATT
jgi:glycosyltransferase involved in cell wall biosynthesis